jgi:hypothetical protein
MIHLCQFPPLLLALACARLTAGEIAPLTPGPPFDYAKHAFQPKAWEQRGLSLQLTPWTGRNVVFLTVDDKLDPALMGLWVSRLDAGWRLYAAVNRVRSNNPRARSPSPQSPVRSLRVGRAVAM